ncbi:MAG: hypothetical protein WC953_07375 [Pseudomonas sp.]
MSNKYNEWLEAQKMTDDAEARRLYAERDSGISYPYHAWRERYGYADTTTARADYAEYQKQLDILTPEKRKPGRPATGNAMTPAEKQRAYRERQKKRNVTGIELTDAEATAIISLLGDKARDISMRSEEPITTRQRESIDWLVELSRKIRTYMTTNQE